MSIDGDILLPSFETVVDPVIELGGSAAFPTFSVSGALVPGPSVTFPLLTVAGVALSGTSTEAVINTPSWQLAGSLEPPLALPSLSTSGALATGELGAGAVQLPALSTNGSVEPPIHIPLLSVSGTGLTGVVFSGAAVLPELTLSGTSYHDGESTGDIDIPRLVVAGQANQITLYAGDVRLSIPTVSGTGVRGNVATGRISMPLWQTDAEGYFDVVGNASFTLPLWQVDGVLTTPAEPTLSALVLNTHTNAVSTYDNTSFNSMCTFKGVVLAASDTGIIALTGADDNGDPINALVKPGPWDFGSTFFKRVLSGYVGYTTDGDMYVTMTTENSTNTYTLKPYFTNVLHTSRVKFGRGARGRYWTWQLTNKDGADFEIDSIGLEVETTTRRI